MKHPSLFFMIGIPDWGWGTNLILMISTRDLFSFIFPTMNISKRDGCIILSIIFQYRYTRLGVGVVLSFKIIVNLMSVIVHNFVSYFSWSLHCLLRQNCIYNQFPSVFFLTCCEYGSVWVSFFRLLWVMVYATSWVYMHLPC